MKSRVNILGAGGFIGSILLKKFTQDDEFDVQGFSSTDCDLLSIDSTREALKDLNKNDIIIMASAITRLQENTFEAMIKNIRMVENISQVILEKDCGQFVFLSSVDVFGSLEKNSKGKNAKIDEECELKPDEYYALGKLTSELLLQKQLGKKGINLAILRFPGVYGPGDEAKSLIGRFMHAAVNEGKITINGDGSDLRDYIYIDWVYEAVREAIRAKLNDTVNVVSDQSYSIKEIAEKIQLLGNRNSRIEFSERQQPETHRKRYMEFNNSKLKRVLPNLKIDDLDRGIALAFEHLEDIQIPQNQSMDNALRKRIVDMIYKAKAGHIPSAFSIIDILSYLYGHVLKFDPLHPTWDQRDYFILSKGHGCAALYVILEKYGFIEPKALDELCQYHGILGGHPDNTKVPGAEASTGSLGHGICLAVGTALGLRIQEKDNKVITLIGDGESNEGTVWEAALVAANLKLGNLCCIIDNNGSAEQILPMAPLKEKWESFGWEAHVIDGHNLNEIERVFQKIKFKHFIKPKVIIANTLKGKGVSFMEVHGPWHYRYPKDDELETIYKELEASGYPNNRLSG